MTDWRAFWNSDHSIYVSARHSDVHYRDVAERIAALVPSRSARVLDYGSGHATHAGLVADVAAELMLCDAAPTVRAAVAARFADHPRIRVMTPEQVETLSDGRLDLIVSNSVVQYLSRRELAQVLTLFRRLLAPGGTLVVADVIPPDVGPMSDAAALLRYAARRGFLADALVGLARTAVSPYRKLRSTLGIGRYSTGEFLRALAEAGFAGERMPRNLEHNPARMTFRARPA